MVFMSSQPLAVRLSLKHAFQTAQMKKISGLHPDSKKYQADVLMNKPSCSEGKPESLPDGKAGLIENPFPTVDDAPLTLQHTDAFNDLTTLPIGLTPPSIPTPDEGVKTPSDADARTACFDIRLLAVPGLMLDASVRVLATFGRPVEVDVFSIKNFKMLIITVFCSKNVYKNLKDVSELPMFGGQFYFDNRFELRLEVCDKISFECEFWARAK